MIAPARHRVSFDVDVVTTLVVMHTVSSVCGDRGYRSSGNWRCAMMAGTAAKVSCGEVMPV